MDPKGSSPSSQEPAIFPYYVPFNAERLLKTSKFGGILFTPIWITAVFG